MTGTSAQQYLRRLFRYALNYKGLLAITLVMGILSFSVTFVYPWVIGSAIDHVIAPRAVNGVLPSSDQRLHSLLMLTIVAAVTAVLFAISAYGRGHCTVKLAHRIVVDLRRDLFDHLSRLSLHFYSKHRTGSIVERVIHEVHGVTGVLHAGLILVAMDVLQLIIAVCLLMAISWKLTVATLVVMPLYLLTFRFFNPRVRQASDQVHRHFCLICGNIQEQLAGIALVKTYGAEEREARRFKADHEEHYGHVVNQSHIGHLVGAISEVLVHLGTTIVIGFGGYLAVKGGPKALTAGDLTRFIGYVGIMYGPVRRFADLNIVYQNSLASMRRVFRVFDITPKVRERSNARTEPPLLGEVRYERVRFRYQDDSDESQLPLDEEDGSCVSPANAGEEKADTGESNDWAHRWVLNGIDFHVNPGERVALVGPSGSGKTTLVSLLPRLFDVGEGRITIDGSDIRDYSLKALREGIAVVQQDSFVFSGSIRDNLVYGRPNATDEEVIAAAKAANAHGFITDLPYSYQTMLGERGVNLSGGQRQRLSIARALLKNPRILILDEATSALDTESEALVQQALNTLMTGRTCLIIAHRLSTVRHADRILVIREGRIAESGRHHDLLELNGLYARLVRQQFGLQASLRGPELVAAAG